MHRCRVPLAWLAAMSVLLAAPGALPAAAAAPEAGPAAVAPAAGAPGPGAAGARPAGMALIRGPGKDPASFQWLDGAGAVRLPLTGDDVATDPLDLGFRFPFYGEAYERVSLSSNGLLTFEGPRPLHYGNVPLPFSGGPGAAIAAFWDDLVLPDDAALTIQRGGEAPARWFAATWNRAGLLADPDARLSFQAVLREDGRVTLSYGPVEHWRAPLWDGATVGMQGPGGKRGLTYRWNAVGGPLAPQTTLEFGPAREKGGPVVSDLRIDPLHAGLYRVSARAEDPDGQPVVEVQLAVTGLDYAGTPVAMVAPEVEAGLSAVSATALVDTLGMPEGIYTFSVRARNAANAWGEAASSEVSVDRVPPATTCSFSPPDGEDGWYLSEAVATCTAVDKLSGVDRIEFRIDGGDWQPYAGEMRISGQGVHQVEYRAADMAGNVELLHHETVAIDAVAPVVSLTGLEPGQRLRHAGVLRVQVEAAETDSGLASLRIELDGNDDLPNADPVELWRLQLGEHVLTVVARDRAGNEAVVGPLPFTVYADIQSVDALTFHLAGRGLIQARAEDLATLRGALAEAERARAAGERWAARQQLLAYTEALQQIYGRGDLTPAAYAVLMADVNYVIDRLTGTEDCTAC